MSLYTDLLAAGQKVSNWQSDLYCPVNEVTQALIKQHKANPTIFTNQVEGGAWFDVPFAFDPFWEQRQ